MATISKPIKYLLLPLVAVYLSSSIAAFAQKPGDSGGSPIVVKIEKCPSFKWLKVLEPKFITESSGELAGFSTVTEAVSTARTKCVEKLQEVLNKSAYPDFKCPEFCQEDYRTPCVKEDLYLPDLSTNGDIHFDDRLTTVVDRERNRTYSASASCSFIKDPNKIPRARAVCWCGETDLISFDFLPES